VESMRAGQRQVGIRSQFCSPLVAETLGITGCDYVYLDMEHSPNDLMSVLLQAQAIAGTPADTLVRVPEFNSVLIQQLLDLGVENIVVPMIESAEQARAAVAATRYPPKGVRSVAKVHRGNAYALDSSYTKTIDDRICLVCMIETRAGLDQIEAIASVEGVHGVLIGPADLAADLGHVGSANHPEVMAAIADALPRIRAAGAFPGMSTGDAASARKWFEAGAQFVSIGGDIQILVEKVRAMVEEASA
jgi:4-hydroxy-2-oxoheptanedioate aldolase